MCEGLDSHRLEVVDVLPLRVHQLGEQLSQPVLLLPSQRAVLPVTQGQPGEKVVDKLGHHPRPVSKLYPQNPPIFTVRRSKGDTQRTRPHAGWFPTELRSRLADRGTARPEKRGAGVHPVRNVAEEESKGTLWRNPRGHFGADEQIFGFHIVRRPEEEFEGDKVIFGCGEQWRQDRCWVQLNLTCHFGPWVCLLPVFLKSAYFSGKKVQIGFHKSKERFWFLCLIGTSAVERPQ